MIDYVLLFRTTLLTDYSSINHLCNRDKALFKKNITKLFLFLFLGGRTTVDVAGVTNAVARGVAIGYSDSIVRACVLLFWLSVKMCSRCDCLLSDGREEHPGVCSSGVCLCLSVCLCVDVCL